jgi:hypothetical protein
MEIATATSHNFSMESDRENGEDWSKKGRKALRVRKNIFSFDDVVQQLRITNENI